MSLRPSIKNVDLRAESTFYDSMAPAGGSVPWAIYLLIKNQVVFPFAQGFFWAVAKDWYQVFAAVARVKGRVVGDATSDWVRQIFMSLTRLGSGLGSGPGPVIGNIAQVVEEL